MIRAGWQQLLRFIALLALSVLALQLYFALRIALMLAVDPQSTSFQRSEAWRLLTQQHRLLWSQQWVGYERISSHLKRAVIASEDAAFTDHSCVDWEALEKAWEKNVRAQARAERINERLAQRHGAKAVTAEVIGGSTITQQLAKNLFLDGERSLPRKGQEFLLTFMLEAMLPKQRILEIYLNNVEWGEGVFGAQAAARHYFHVDAAQLGAYPAARLAVMLPAPKRFEKRPDSPYVSGRAGTIVARMAAVDLP
ncbi:MAG: monofunctional biosynthetic peptidoglycan transglycosylase [Betaproteobacteria bacterium]|nr:MAG: monofunctional biosynthetic peptidoglycan transglycosylase [Betaproteobacteria bacterium]